MPSRELLGAIDRAVALRLVREPESAATRTAVAGFHSCVEEDP
jgi:hypothetical protein